MAKELLYICEDLMWIVSREWCHGGVDGGDKITGPLKSNRVAKGASNGSCIVVHALSCEH